MYWTRWQIQRLFKFYHNKNDIMTTAITTTTTRITCGEADGSYLMMLLLLLTGWPLTVKNTTCDTCDPTCDTCASYVNPLFRRTHLSQPLTCDECDHIIHIPVTNVICDKWGPTEPFRVWSSIRMTLHPNKRAPSWMT